MHLQGMSLRHRKNLPSIWALHYPKKCKYIPTRTSGFIGDLGSDMQFVLCISVRLVAKINIAYWFGVADKLRGLHVHSTTLTRHLQEFALTDSWYSRLQTLLVQSVTGTLGTDGYRHSWYRRLQALLVQTLGKDGYRHSWYRRLQTLLVQTVTDTLCTVGYRHSLYSRLQTLLVQRIQTLGTEVYRHSWYRRLQTLFVQ